MSSTSAQISKGWETRRHNGWKPNPNSYSRWAGKTGENAPNWKGDEAGYRAIHIWVNKTLGKAMKCSNNASHLSTRYHWANISKEYKRDVNDWKELCPSCNLKDNPVKGGVYY